MSEQRLAGNSCFELLWLELTVEKRYVAGVDLAFDVLEIIAVLEALVYVDVALWN